MRVHVDNWTEIYTRFFYGCGPKGFRVHKEKSNKNPDYHVVVWEGYITEEQLIERIRDLKKVTTISAVRRAGKLLEPDTLANID